MKTFAALKKFVALISLLWACLLPVNVQAITYIPWSADLGCAYEYAESKPPVVVHIVLPLLREDLPPKRSRDDPPHFSSPDEGVRLLSRGAFERVAYLGYFVVTHGTKDETPVLVWHPALGLDPSDSLYEQYANGLQKVEQLEAVLQKNAETYKAERSGRGVRVLWWKSFFYNLKKFSLLIAAPGEPPVPGWQPQFNDFYDIACSAPDPAQTPPQSTAERCFTTVLVENPTPQMKQYYCPPSRRPYCEFGPFSYTGHF